MWFYDNNLMLIFTLANHHSPSANLWYWKCHRWKPHTALIERSLLKLSRSSSKDFLSSGDATPKKPSELLLHSECTHLWVRVQKVVFISVVRVKFSYCKSSLGMSYDVSCKIVCSTGLLSGFCNMSYSEIYHQTLKTMTYGETRQHKHRSTSSSILSLWLQKMHFKNHQDFLYQTKTPN